jgi:hypothetical protein
MENNNNGAYKATLVLTSDNVEDSPFHLEVEFDPPFDETVDPVPTAYQFMSMIMERVVLPTIAFNERYEADMAESVGDAVKH